MSRFGTERKAVQKPLIRYAEEAGWTYLPPEEAQRLRRGTDGLLLHEAFIRQAQALNPGVVDVGRAEELAGRVIRVKPNLEGNLEAWEYLRGLKTVFLPEENRELNANLLDPEAWRSNTFHVTDELRYTGGTDPIRIDVAFFVNGIPVLLIEAKAAHKQEGIAEALDQVRRYHREGSPLLALFQLYAVTHLVQYYYGPTWNVSRKALLNWRDEAAGDFETLVKTFIHAARVAKVLHDFVLFTRKDGELSKVVLRPHQMRAIERILRRARDPERRRGLVWHTQGSGKTFTMITTARKLLEEAAFEHPTVLMLVDRNELEQQLFGNLESLGFKGVEVADSKEHVRRLLRSDYRGLVVSTIHKFEGMPERINTRSNIFVLVDEAHRTTNGDLGTYLMAGLPNATLLGFTGTPIDRTARGTGTFQIFGKDDERGYLDKYSIRESIHDQTTVPLHYALAPNELRVDKETLEQEFLGKADAEGISDIEELNRVLDKAVTLKNMMKNRERVEKVARYVAEHYQDYVKPLGFKAFLVAVDREACALYKDALDKAFPPEASAVVYSSGHNDNENLKRFHLERDQERRVRDAFTKEENPQILVVTEKLLTGFDAPMLYAMYLDKPMRDHVLLQTIARVNRTYKGKPAGLVIDFVGIFDNLERALAFDSQEVAEVVQDLGVLKERFTVLMARARAEYLLLAAGDDEKAIERVLEAFRDEEVRHELYGFFREVRDIYEILSPDAFLRPYLDDYDLLARVVRTVREAYEPSPVVDREFTRKTARLVQEHTHGSVIGKALDVYQIDEELLDQLAQSTKPDTVKVFNLLKSVEQKIDEEAHEKPFVASIGEKAEAIAKTYESRQETTQQALARLEELIREINQAEAEFAEKNLDTSAFTVYWMLHQEGLAEAEPTARQMSDVFERYPHWLANPAQEREVRTALYKILLQTGVSAKRLVELVDQIVKVLSRRA